MTKSEEPLIRIVDDDEALCEAISFVLEGEGYETAVYQSAESYLERMIHRGMGCSFLTSKWAA
ncbi:response regulator transcription factor [Sutterella seckii]|uniref:hypothetical protein n=1 Tax=Sutterella seckii TaxID=1944635 RepID=UPI001D054CBE|nr:hypothetical protein [Sutterella seckii]